MVRQAIEGNTEALVAYNREFRTELLVVVYTKNEKKVVSPYIKYIESDKEEVRIRWKGGLY